MSEVEWLQGGADEKFNYLTIHNNHAILSIELKKRSKTEMKRQTKFAKFGFSEYDEKLIRYYKQAGFGIMKFADKLLKIRQTPKEYILKTATRKVTFYQIIDIYDKNRGRDRLSILSDGSMFSNNSNSRCSDRDTLRCFATKNTGGGMTTYMYAVKDLFDDGNKSEAFVDDWYFDAIEAAKEKSTQELVDDYVNNKILAVVPFAKLEEQFFKAIALQEKPYWLTATLKSLFEKGEYAKYDGGGYNQGMLIKKALKNYFGNKLLALITEKITNNPLFSVTMEEVIGNYIIYTKLSGKGE